MLYKYICYRFHQIFMVYACKVKLPLNIKFSSHNGKFQKKISVFVRSREEIPVLSAGRFGF